MISRSHVKGDAPSIALYSDCETYRYALTRTWDVDGRRLLFIMLNPSKATEVQNDPTIERCERRARALGYGSFRACNIFALRETDPHKMRKHSDPNGPENDIVLLEACEWADDVLCAWGAHGTHLGRGWQVEETLRKADFNLLSLGQTKGGHPRHPLYIAYAEKPRMWQGTG